MAVMPGRAPVTIAALVVVALAACKDEGIEALKATRERVCACQDAVCVQAAMDALPDKPTRHQRRAEGLARDITNCIARIYRYTDARENEDEEPVPEAEAGPPGVTGP